VPTADIGRAPLVLREGEHCAATRTCQ